jgi:hypothetical protein
VFTLGRSLPGCRGLVIGGIVLAAYRSFDAD